MLKMPSIYHWQQGIMGLFMQPSYSGLLQITSGV